MKGLFVWCAEGKQTACSRPHALQDALSTDASQLHVGAVLNGVWHCLVSTCKLSACMTLCSLHSHELPCCATPKICEKS